MTAPSDQPALRPGRGRRPASQVKAAALAAASDLLLEHGVAAVTFEKVATASGVSRTTLYKWWPSPGVLAAEAYFTSSVQVLAFPDTGDIETDLKQQLRAFVRLVTGTPSGKAIAGLIAAAQADPAVSEALSEHYTRPRRMLAVRVLERAQARGQLREDIDPHTLVDQLWGACYNRLLIPDQRLDEEVADRFVETVLHGAAARPPVSPAGDVPG